MGSKYPTKSPYRPLTLQRRGGETRKQLKPRRNRQDHVSIFFSILLSLGAIGHLDYVSRMSGKRKVSRRAYGRD
jgi:hypothetical protein